MLCHPHNNDCSIKPHLPLPTVGRGFSGEKSQMSNRQKYVVHLANIMDDDGNKVCHGETVELSMETAKHYNKLGFLRPYFGDEKPNDDDEDEEGGDDNSVGRAAPKLVRSRRGAPESGSTPVPPSPSSE